MPVEEQNMIHDDPVAAEVEQDLRDNGMIPAKLPEWQPAFRPTLIPDEELILGHTVIRLNTYGTATLTVLSFCSKDNAKSEAPAKILAELELAAADIRQYIAAMETMPCPPVEIGDIQYSLACVASNGCTIHHFHEVIE